MTHAYHLAVVGDHLGGLAAAALAARRGRRVLLFETGETSAGRPLEFLNAVTGGPEQEVALGRFFHELGRSPFGPLGDDRIHFRSLSPPLQVVLPRHRVTVYQERTARNWELQREFGDAPRALAALWEQEERHREQVQGLFSLQEAQDGRSLPARAIGSVSGLLRIQGLERQAEARTFADFLRAQDLEPDLRETLELQAFAVMRRPPAALGWAAGLRALRVSQGGLYQNTAGLSGILAGLKEILRAAGGECRPLPSLEGLEVPKSGAARVHLAAGGAVRADRLLFDLPLAQALRLLPPESARDLQRKGLELREECEYGLLELRIRADRRPELMGRVLVISPPPGEPAPTVLIAGQPVEAAEPDEDYALEALGFFPPGAAGGARERLLERLTVVMPFLAESLVGETYFHRGPCARPVRTHSARRQREETLRTGYRPAVFAHRQLVFLCNGDYADCGLAEGILSGSLAVD